MASTSTKPIDAYLTTATSAQSEHLPFDPAKLWSSSRPKPEGKKPETKLFYDVDQKGALGAVVSTGTGAHEGKTVGEKKEALRAAVALGVKKLKEAGATSIGIDVSGNAAHVETACKCAGF